MRQVLSGSQNLSLAEKYKREPMTPGKNTIG
jgi:hypothetical protein